MHFAVILALVAGATSLLAQTPAGGSVSVGGDVSRPFTLTLADLKAMPRTTVKLGNPQRPAVYEGVLLVV